MGWLLEETGSSRIVTFMDFGEYVKMSRSGVVLYKVLFCFLVNKFIVERAFNIFSNSFTRTQGYNTACEMQMCNGTMLCFGYLWTGK